MPPQILRDLCAVELKNVYQVIEETLTTDVNNTNLSTVRFTVPNDESRIMTVLMIKDVMITSCISKGELEIYVKVDNSVDGSDGLVR